MGKPIAQPAAPVKKPRKPYTHSGKFVGKWGKSKQAEIKRAAHDPAAPASPAQKEPIPPKMRILRESDTAAEDFREALHKTVVPEPPPAPEPAEPAENVVHAEASGGGSAHEEPKEPPKEAPGKESKEEPKEDKMPPGYDFDFKFDDTDVEVMLEMVPLITIPFSSLIAWFFGRTLDESKIEMTDFKKQLLRPGIKHYGYKIMQMICNPEFFWTALVGIIIFDAIFNSTKNPPEGEEHYHREAA